MENYILAYDAETGEFVGFYLRSIHGDSIPEPNVEITPEKHAFYMEHNGQYKLNPATLEDVLIVPDFSESVQQKKNQIDSDCANKINAGFYSAVEQSKDSSGVIQKLLYKCDLTHQLNFGYYINTLIPAHKQGTMTSVSCTWKDASVEGPCHPISDTIAQFLYTLMGLHVQWCRTTADSLKDQVNNAKTIDDVSSISFPDEPDLDVQAMALFGITDLSNLSGG